MQGKGIECGKTDSEDVSMPVMRIFALFALLLAGGSAQAQEGDAPLRVVASIKPLHSLAAGLMQGVAEPHLLIPGAANPHDYRLRPSEAESLQNADVLFWIGGGFEGGNLATLAGNARIVALAQAGGKHEEHDEHDEHDDHDEHGGHAGHGEHGGAEGDLHIWLDPHRAEGMVADMEAALIAADGENASLYRANAEALSERLHHLDERLAARMAPLRGRGSYIVFHDAYAHFEARYGLRSAGALLDASAHGHEHGPSARRMAQLRQRIMDEDADIACVFVEPAFDAAAAETLVQGSEAKIVRLDPIGADIPAGADAYFTLLENMGDSFARCLGA